MWQTSSRSASFALTASISAIFSMVFSRSKSISSNSIRPASIFERSRISLRSPSKESADVFTNSRSSRCSLVKSVASTSSVIPMMPFIGVRISWLMFARNSLFALLAASAASFAAWRVFSARILSVTSRMIPRNPLGLPSKSLINVTEDSVVILVPSFLIKSYTNPLFDLPVS